MDAVSIPAASTNRIRCLVRSPAVFPWVSFESRAGVDLATLRELMGHSYISVTSRYLAATPQRQEAVAALAALPGPGEPRSSS